MADKLILIVSLISLGLTVYALRDQLFPASAVNFIAAASVAPGVQI